MYAHALGGVLARDIPGEVVQLGQAATVGVGHQQVHGRSVRELLLDALPKLLQTLAADAADEHGVGVAQAELLAPLLVEQVGLVEDEQARAVAGADLLERLLDRAAHQLLLGLRRGGVEHMQEQIGPAGLLERRRERVDELVGQLSDEADGVGEQIAGRPPTLSVRVVGSRVWNRRSRTPTSAPVSAFSSVDLPAFV